MPLLTPAIPSLGLILMAGPYQAQAIACEQVAVLTNTVATAAYRGADRPEATAAIERLMDTMARALPLDPAEVRRRHCLRDLSRPTPAGRLYESGNYAAALEKALALGGYAALRAEHQRLRAQGRYLGIGRAS